MSMRDRAALLVLALAAVLGIIWTLSNVRQALTPPPPGGIGAVSSGVGVTVLLLCGLLLINWLLSGAALRHGPLAQRVRRTHLWLTVTYLVWIVVSEVWFRRAYGAGAEALGQAMKVLGVVGAPFPSTPAVLRRERVRLLDWESNGRLASRCDLTPRR